jgi:hypothetical protein
LGVAVVNATEIRGFVCNQKSHSSRLLELHVGVKLSHFGYLSMNLLIRYLGRKEQDCGFAEPEKRRIAL